MGEMFVQRLLKVGDFTTSEILGNQSAEYNIRLFVFSDNNGLGGYSGELFSLASSIEGESLKP